MFNFILGIVVIIIGLGISVFGMMEEDKKMVAIALPISMILGFVLIILSFFTSISTGSTGIVTTFGKVEDYTLDEGIHTKKPWQSVIEMDNRVQKSTVQLSCFSSDIQEVQVSYTLNHQINKATASNLYRTVGKNYYDTVITPIVAESVKTIIAKYTAEQLVSTRDKLANEIENLLSISLEKYNIDLVSSAIEDMDFTDAFTNAVEAKQVAAQQKLQAEIEQQQKTMEAQQIAERAKIEAEANAEVAKTKAQADAEVAKIQANADLEVQKINADAAEYTGQKEAAKNKVLSENLNEALLRYFFIQQWDGKYPEYYVGTDDVSTIVGMPNGR